MGLRTVCFKMKFSFTPGKSEKYLRVGGIIAVTLLR